MNEGFLKAVKKVKSIADKIEKAPKRAVSAVKNVIKKPAKEITSAVKKADQALNLKVKPLTSAAKKLQSVDKPEVKIKKPVVPFKKFIKSKLL